jgi:hypothetical protein
VRPAARAATAAAAEASGRAAGAMLAAGAEDSTWVDARAATPAHYGKIHSKCGKMNHGPVNHKGHVTRGSGIKEN